MSLMGEFKHHELLIEPSNSLENPQRTAILLRPRKLIHAHSNIFHLTTNRRVIVIKKREKLSSGKLGLDNFCYCSQSSLYKLLGSLVLRWYCFSASSKIREKKAIPKTNLPAPLRHLKPCPLHLRENLQPETCTELHQYQLLLLLLQHGSNRTADQLQAPCSRCVSGCNLHVRNFNTVWIELVMITFIHTAMSLKKPNPDRRSSDIFKILFLKS